MFIAPKKRDAGHMSKPATLGISCRAGLAAIALMLLTGAGLLIHSFMNAVAINPGFDPRGMVTGRIAIPLAHRSSDDAGGQLQQRVLQSLHEMSGVTSAALGVAVPFQGGLPVNAFTLAEDTLPPCCSAAI